MSALSGNGDAVIEQAMAVLEHVWAGTAKRTRVPAADVRGVVHLELRDSLARFSQAKGESFERYATRGVIGAVFDAVGRDRGDPVWAVVAGVVRRGLWGPPEREEDESLTLPADDDPSPTEIAVEALQARVAAVVGQLVLGPAVVEGEADLVERIHTARALEIMVAAVRTLDSDDQRIIELLYERALNAEEAAAVLGVSDRTVRRIHARVRQRLAAALRAAGVGVAGKT